LWLLLLLPLVAAIAQFGPLFVRILLAAPLLLVFLAQPLLIALLLGWVSHEARVLGETDSTERKLGFGVVAGMVFVLLGGLVWNLLFMQGGGNTQMIFLPAMPLVAVIVAIGPLVEFLRSRGRMQAPPKDASPFDTGSAQKP